MQKLFNKWHDWLDMPKFDAAWHQADMQDELAEFRQETNWFKKWSETSDVVYTYSRSQWSGHSLDFPLTKRHLVLGTIYMFPKYTGRFLFFRQAGRKAGADKVIRCVRNPKKLYKLDAIISHQNIAVDRELLHKVCKKQLRYWPLLP